MTAESPESIRDAAEVLGQDDGLRRDDGLCQETVSREVVVVNTAGLHARPADLLAREARKWRSRIELVNDSQRADGKSILELLTLAAEAGTRLVVQATGPDAREALEAIGSLFESRFNEHENDQES